MSELKSQYDLIVVGSGAAGLAAALMALCGLEAAARACGRGGELDAGLELLGRLREGGLAVDDGTYSALSLACLGAGRAELATELLEERDYL